MYKYIHIYTHMHMCVHIACNHHFLGEEAMFLGKTMQEEEKPTRWQ